VAFLGAACVYIGQGALARNAPAPGAAQSIPASTATVADAAGRIRQNIDRYLRSIDAADADLANGLWLQSPEASFIHPLGEERGWQQIKDHFYGTLMGKMLSQRELKLVGDPQIQIFGCAAVAQFNWNFVATRRDTGHQVHTIGRESQLYVRQTDGQWLLVHVHYSGPAVKPDSGAKGF